VEPFLVAHAWLLKNPVVEKSPLRSLLIPPPAEKEASKTAGGHTAGEYCDWSHGWMPSGVRAVRMVLSVVTRHSGIVKTAGTVQARVH
jgi:hypothetical protein